METITLVQKEEIPGMKFVAAEVLHQAEAIKARSSFLDRAVILGNGYHGKVKIVFETLEGTKAVETTVWQAADDQVTLKAGVHIPIHAIREIIM